MVLRKAGHDVATPADLDISGAPDPVHLTRAIRVGRVLLTRNARDFTIWFEHREAAIRGSCCCTSTTIPRAT